MITENNYRCPIAGIHDCDTIENLLGGGYEELPKRVVV